MAAGAARLTFPRLFPPPPAPPPQCSAPWRDSALRAGEKLRGRHLLGSGPGLPLPGRRLLFRSQWRRSLLCRLSENGGSEAGRERPGFPAGAQRRGLQTRRGQVHHARVRPGPSLVAPGVRRCFPFGLSRSRFPVVPSCSGMSGAARSPRPLPSRPQLLGRSPPFVPRGVSGGHGGQAGRVPSPGDTRYPILNPSTGPVLGGGPALFFPVWERRTSARACVCPFLSASQLSLAS